MINFNLPLNQTSFGQVSYNIVRALIDGGREFALIPIGRISISETFETENSVLEMALRAPVENGSIKFDRGNPSFKLWHTVGLRESVGNPSHAMTFHETSEITDFEAGILNSLEKIFVSSRYTAKVFSSKIPKDKIIYCPLGFDAQSFFRINDLKVPDAISFGLRGKFEKRKHTAKIIKAWVSKYGNDMRYRLDCSIHNQFMKEREFNETIRSLFHNGTKPANVNFLPYYTPNSMYNETLNMVDIDLTGMSGCEGFNLPLFQSLCIGKQAVVLNAHVHKDYCDNKNSFLVEPSGMIDAYDGKFFIEGANVNQGQFFDFNVDEFIAAMERAELVAKSVNTAGEKLASEYTYQKTTEIILDAIL